MTTETLLTRGWAETDDAEPSYVWVTMRRLRQKLEVDANRPRHLLTVRGVGYRLVATRPGPAERDSGTGDAPRGAAPATDDDSATAPPEPRPGRSRLSFQTRLNLTLLAAAIIPLGDLRRSCCIAIGAVDPQIGERLLLFMFAIAVAIGVLGGSAVGLNLVAPLREISTAVSRVSAGDMSQPIPVVGDDVLAQLAESHNRLAADAERRNRQLGLILAAVESAEPRDGVDAMAERAGRDAETRSASSRRS